MQRLETEELPVIQTKSFELQHFHSLLRTLWLKMLLCMGSIRKKKKKLASKEWLKFKGTKQIIHGLGYVVATLAPPMVQSHLSICLCVSGPCEPTSLWSFCWCCAVLSCTSCMSRYKLPMPWQSCQLVETMAAPGAGGRPLYPNTASHTELLPCLTPSLQAHSF